MISLFISPNRQGVPTSMFNKLASKDIGLDMTEHVVRIGKKFENISAPQLKNSHLQDFVVIQCVHMGL